MRNGSEKKVDKIIISEILFLIRIGDIIYALLPNLDAMLKVGVWVSKSVVEDTLNLARES